MGVHSLGPGFRARLVHVDSPGSETQAPGPDARRSRAGVPTLLGRIIRKEAGDAFAELLSFHLGGRTPPKIVTLVPAPGGGLIGPSTGKGHSLRPIRRREVRSATAQGGPGLFQIIQVGGVAVLGRLIPLFLRNRLGLFQIGEVRCLARRRLLVGALAIFDL
jgi:hypothetical protein